MAAALERADPNPLTELDKAHLADLIARHPKSAITVRRGFMDGSEWRPFGFVPNDWDGTHVVYDFRMVAPISAQNV
jgi:hypothetical protein